MVKRFSLLAFYRASKDPIGQINDFFGSRWSFTKYPKISLMTIPGATQFTKTSSTASLKKSSGTSTSNKTTSTSSQGRFREILKEKMFDFDQ